MNDSLSAREQEDQKSDKDRSDDWSYTLSHMTTCLLTDPFTPFLAAFLQKKATGRSNTLEHLEGEFLGDVMAVPITIGVQRFAPEVTQSIRNVIEPLARGAYQKGATQAAESWAHQRHISEDSPEFYAYQQQQYEYEMSRLPLQLLWTTTSVLGNVASQKILFNNQEKMTDVLWAVGVSAGVTLGIQNIGRIFMPEAMHWVDNVASNYAVKPINDHIVTPITRIFTQENARGDGKIMDYQTQLSV
jgi:hypothetical protein